MYDVSLIVYFLKQKCGKKLINKKIYGIRRNLIFQNKY